MKKADSQLLKSWLSSVLVLGIWFVLSLTLWFESIRHDVSYNDDNLSHKVTLPVSSGGQVSGSLCYAAR